MRINDDALDILADFFRYHHIQKKYNITFEEFLEMYSNNTWQSLRDYDRINLQNKTIFRQKHLP